ncbi:MAG: hypothetical protein RMK84_12325 [Oscillochloridaceae bacterium]|nr:hypothetical protein [Chloroflexaceae bacterium]MDW8390905.1 hypothetical protein [Oscillochloridaceae bacterium]
MSREPGIDAIETITRLYSAREPVPTLGACCFPGCWPIARNSPWNRARAAAKITLVAVGPARHNRWGGYKDLPYTSPDAACSI